MGDRFSIGSFLTNWNKLSSESKTALFGNGDLSKNLNQLALLADRVKGAEALAGHSNTGAVLEFNKGAPGAAIASAIGGAVTGHGGIGIGGAALIMLSAGGRAGFQRGAAELLTSPAVVRWMARAPRVATPEEQRIYIDKLADAARAEPAIAGNILSLKDALEAAYRPSSGMRAAAGTGDNQGNSQTP